MCSEILSRENDSKILLFFKNLCVLWIWVKKMQGKFAYSTQIFVLWYFEFVKCKRNSPLWFWVVKISKKIPLFHANLCILWFWIVKISLFYTNLSVLRFWVGKMTKNSPLLQKLLHHKILSWENLCVLIFWVEKTFQDCFIAWPRISTTEATFQSHFIDSAIFQTKSSDFLSEFA